MYLYVPLVVTLMPERNAIADAKFRNKTKNRPLLYLGRFFVWVKSKWLYTIGAGPLPLTQQEHDLL